MNTTTPEQVLLDTLVARRDELDASLHARLVEVFSTDLDNMALMTQMSRDNTFESKLRSAINELIEDHEKGTVKGNWIREWLQARGELHTYADTIRNWGDVKPLPLALRIEFHIEMLRTKHIKIHDQLHKDNRSLEAQLRRGNYLVALQEHHSRLAYEAAAVELERLLAA